MYTGTMIEDLIESVARAEKLAQRQPLPTSQPPARLEIPLACLRDFSYGEELVGVA